jgi:hypothetical protein
MPDILLPVVKFTERKRIKSRTRFGAKSTQNLKICMKNTYFLIAIFNILAPFWHLMPDILLPVVKFTERKRIKSRTRFGAKSTQNLKICMKNTYFLIAIFNILAPFWHCKVIPYRLENLGLLLHTSETRSLPRVATKRSTQKSETLGE